MKEQPSFDPKKNLDELRSTPSGPEKRVKLEEYKEQLAIQKENLAKTQEELIRIIREAPDTELIQLKNKAQELVGQYGLSEEQKNKIFRVLDNYDRKHRAVRAVRKKYPDDSRLFEAIFGRPPKGKIEVIEGPITLYFRCRSRRDFAVAYSGSFLNAEEVGLEDFLYSLATSGVVIDSTLIPELNRLVIMENTWILSSKKNQKDTYIHEEQHVIKNLFGEAPIRKWKGYGAYRDKQSFIEFLRTKRERGAELGIKDELLAFMKGERITPEEIFSRLSAFGFLSDYDYMDEERRDLLKLYSNGESREIKKEIKDAVKQVFVGEYRALIKDGIQAFTDLRNNGYSVEQTIAILNAEPLAKWSKVVRRLLEQKALRNEN